MTNQHTHPPKKPKRSTDAKAGRKGRGQRARAKRRYEKVQRERSA
jgi:hypothetical protein